MIFCLSSYANTNVVKFTHDIVNRTTDAKEYIDFDQKANGTQESPIEATIKEIVENPEKYENKIVLVSGVCSKINLAIMSRNWIHLKDGSKDDFDFVITSKDKVEKGDRVSIQGVIRVKVDFGFGYNYDVIMQEAEVVD
jgi:hypothetical protein